MSETISIISDVCGILGFILSIFAVSKVYKLTKANSQLAIGKKNKQKINTGGN